MRSDAALIAAARTDAGAFRELYDRYAERVLGYHLRRSRDEDAAHELTAETFAQAWLARARFRDECVGTKGTVEPTVDASKHVNGGCRSLRSDGREWACYIGEEAVRQQIMGPDFLGDYAPAPGVG